MLNTLTSATFKYKGRTITARRAANTLNDKFFCWYGELDDVQAVAHKSLNKFEEEFKALVDKSGERPTVESF